MPKTVSKIEAFVSPSEFRDVVLDVEAYPEFLDEVKKVRVAERDDESMTATFEIAVSFGGFDVKTEYTLKYDFGEENVVSWTLLSSPDLTKNEGSWRLEVGEDEDETIAHYEAEIVSSLPIPEVVQESFAEQALPELLEAFQSRVEG